jgi:hypothetical protein
MPNSKETIKMDTSDHVRTVFNSKGGADGGTGSDKGVRETYQAGPTNIRAAHEGVGAGTLVGQPDLAAGQNQLESELKMDEVHTISRSCETPLPEGCLVRAGE